VDFIRQVLKAQLKKLRAKMKRKDDPRHIERVEAMKALFEKSFRPQSSIVKDSIASEVFKNKQKIDALIKKNAPAWPISQVSPIDLALLRLAIWELIVKKKPEPYKVVVDEAVEIAKEYGSESSPSFVNGVLGSIIKDSIKAN